MNSVKTTTVPYPLVASQEFLSVPATRDISTWFLGTRAENGAEFKEPIAKAVDHIVQYRQEYLPGETITSQVKASPEYQGGMSALRDAYDKLLEYLREYSTPHFSMRYQGHVWTPPCRECWAISTVAQSIN